MRRPSPSIPRQRNSVGRRIRACRCFDSGPIWLTGRPRACRRAVFPELRTSSGAHSFGCIHRHPMCWEGLALENDRRARCTPGLTDSVLVQSILTATTDAFMTDTAEFDSELLFLERFLAVLRGHGPPSPSLQGAYTGQARTPRRYRTLYTHYPDRSAPAQEARRPSAHVLTH